MRRISWCIIITFTINDVIASWSRRCNGDSIGSLVVASLALSAPATISSSRSSLRRARLKEMTKMGHWMMMATSSYDLKYNLDEDDDNKDELLPIMATNVSGSMSPQKGSLLSSTASTSPTVRTLHQRREQQPSSPLSETTTTTSKPTAPRSKYPRHGVVRRLAAAARRASAAAAAAASTNSNSNNNDNDDDDTETLPTLQALNAALDRELHQQYHYLSWQRQLQRQHGDGQSDNNTNAAASSGSISIDVLRPARDSVLALVQHNMQQDEQIQQEQHRQQQQIIQMQQQQQQQPALTDLSKAAESDLFPHHSVAVIFAKPLMHQDRISVEYALRIQRLIQAMLSPEELYQPEVICFIDDSSMHQHQQQQQQPQTKYNVSMSAVDAGYRYFRHLCASLAAVGETNTIMEEDADLNNAVIAAAVQVNRHVEELERQGRIFVHQPATMINDDKLDRTATTTTATATNRQQQQQQPQGQHQQEGSPLDAVTDFLHQNVVPGWWASFIQAHAQAKSAAVAAAEAHYNNASSSSFDKDPKKRQNSKTISFLPRPKPMLSPRYSFSSYARPVLFVHFSLFSADYHLCVLHDTHVRSPVQSPLATLNTNGFGRWRSTDDKNAMIIETTWRYYDVCTAVPPKPLQSSSSSNRMSWLSRHADDAGANCAVGMVSATDPGDHQDMAEARAFAAPCYRTAQSLRPVLHNLRGVLRHQEFFQRDNYRALVSARRNLVLAMETLYVEQPSLHSIHHVLHPDILEPDQTLDVMLERSLLSLGRCLDLVRPAGLFSASVAVNQWKLASSLLQQAIDLLTVACDPDVPLPATVWGFMFIDDDDNDDGDDSDKKKIIRVEDKVHDNDGSEYDADDE